jgi:TetR/AcrR family transcriptional regulator, cholesterol catabolism regulator
MPSCVNGRREHRSARKRQILDAAAYVISTKGYAGLRLTHVAERANLDATAIYGPNPQISNSFRHES